MASQPETLDGKGALTFKGIVFERSLYSDIALLHGSGHVIFHLYFKGRKMEGRQCIDSLSGGLAGLS